MAPKRINPNRIKIHRSYTICEAARICAVHKQTVRNWMKAGLPSMKQRKPHLILGRELREFHAQRRKQAKQPCKAGELYCLRCRKPQHPAGDMLDYLPVTLISGNLRGICPRCGSLIHRRVSLAKIDKVSGGCTVAYPQGQQPLSDTSTSSPNCHLAKEFTDRGKA